VSVQYNGGWHDVNIEVLPLTGQNAGHLLVLFEENGAPPAASPATRPVRRRPAAQVAEDDERVVGLTRELAASREYLQSIIQELEAANEELQSANEEILSSNEELQSTNEELDTAKEELQSTNEELNTVNEELHARNEELSRVNSDLVNLVASVQIPIVIVGEDLRIRRFTPMAERLLNVIPTDVGRPIAQINPNIICPDLTDLIGKTIERVAPLEREVQDREGHWYVLRIRPYKNLENRIDGAVLALLDLDADQRYGRKLERARGVVAPLLDVLELPVIVLDAEIRIRMMSAAASRLLGVADSDAVIGRNFSELSGGDSINERLRHLLQQPPSDDGGAGTSVTFTVRAHDGGQSFAADVRRVRIDSGRDSLLLLLRSVGHVEARDESSDG
jgi:two-component system CheB/CheR fusion protein